MMSEYEKGYKKALEDINKPMEPIIKNWEPSECPRCGKDYFDFEPCNDGYYQRATSLERCPYCGQRLKWYDND